MSKIFIMLLLVTGITCTAGAQKLLPTGWDAETEADKVLAGLINICGPKVKGAHDSDLIILNGKAYIVYMANDRQPGENPAWDFVYAALSVVDLESGKVEKIIPVAEGGQVFANATLRQGAIFVPRMIIKDPQTLRCFFAVEQPGKFGFNGRQKDYGLYPFDIKQFDGQTYVALSNFPGGLNALAILHEELLTFEIRGHYNEPGSIVLNESAFNRMPDGSGSRMESIKQR